MTGQPCRNSREREPGRFNLWITERGWSVLSIIRHMREKQNLLGLGSLWDTEIHNAQWDEDRDRNRERRGQLFLRDALIELAGSDYLTVTPRFGTVPLHVRRIGMMWVDGQACGSRDRTIVHLSAVRHASETTVCGCALEIPRVYELVPFGAVLRELERKSAKVSIVHESGGRRGRIVGVWRDAVTIMTQRGRFVLPLSECGVIVVEDSNGL